MQVVIDIPDQEVPRKQDIIDISLHFINGEVCECSYPYMVLPKGHGRLFDERDIVNGNYEVIGNKIYELEPIIEADKAESEDKE